MRPQEFQKWAGAEQAAPVKAMTAKEFIDYLAQTHNIKPSKAVLMAVELLGVTKDGIYKWLKGAKNPHPGKLHHMRLIVENDALKKRVKELEEHLDQK